VATFTDLIKVIFQVDTSQAKQGMAQVEGQTQQAEGAFGKLRAGVGNMGSSIKTALADPMTQLGIAAAGTAVAIGTKLVMAFQDTALAAGKLADATGLTTQEAGQLLEVFSDVGVSAETVQSGIGKMNKAIGTNRDEFEKLGLVGKTTGETFLNVVNYLHNIPDPADRAAAATKLLGKGWADMSEVIAAGGTQLTEAMDKVSSHKAVSPEQVAEARKFRDEMDNLSDTVDEVKLTLGEGLVPTLTETAHVINDVIGPVNDLAEHFGGLGGAIKFVQDWVNPITAPIHKIGDGISAIKGLFGDDEPEKKQSKASQEVADRYNDMAKAAKDAESDTGDLGYAQEQATRTTKEQADEAKANADAMRDMQAGINDALKAENSMTDAILASVDANYGAIKAHKEATDALHKRGSSEEEVMGAVLKSASADEERAKQTALAAGKTWDANDKNASYVKSLTDLQGQTKVGSPTWLAIQALIDQLNAVPKATNTVVNVDTAEAERKLAAAAAGISKIVAQAAAAARSTSSSAGAAAGGTSVGGLALAPSSVTNVSIRTGLAASDRAVAREVRRQLNRDRFSG